MGMSSMNMAVFVDGSPICISGFRFLDRYFSGSGQNRIQL